MSDLGYATNVQVLCNQQVTLTELSDYFSADTHLALDFPMTSPRSKSVNTTTGRYSWIAPVSCPLTSAGGDLAEEER